MLLSIYGEVVNCDNIIRTNNSVKAFNVNNECICHNQGISNFADYLVDGVPIINVIPVTEEVTLDDKVTTLEEENTQLKQQLGLLPPVSNPTSLNDYKTNKICELSKACESEILAGFYSECRGTREWFTNSRDDQNYIKNQYDLARDFPGIFIPQWKSASETVCTNFTFEQMRQLVLDGAAFLVERKHTYDIVTNQVDDITETNGLQAAIEEVQLISWTNKVW